MRRAVVLGGSIAGLLAARVLSDHADEVLVLERDDIAPRASSGAARAPPEVKQGAQMHALLDGGAARSTSGSQTSPPISSPTALRSRTRAGTCTPTLGPP